MSTLEKTTWRHVIKDYIGSLDDENKKESYVDELVSIFLAKNLLNVTAENKNEQAGLAKLKNKISKTKITAANRPRFESFYHILRDKNQIKDYSSELNFIAKKNNFLNIWICRSVELSEGVVPGTHIAKLSHSSSSGSSFLDRSEASDNKYLTTSSLNKEIIDGTYPDAKLSKQVKFLLLECGGSRLFDELLKKNYSVFSGLEESECELEYWVKSYSLLLSESPKTDFLLKQLYFPAGGDYHLLSVLPSSSLTQKIYDMHFSKEARRAKEKLQKSRRSEKYFDQISIRLPSVARLLVTQSQPQNVSVLNGRRGGAIRVFSSSPPAWKSRIESPLHFESWFDRGVPSSSISEDIEYLRNFILRFDQIALSTKDPNKQRWLVKWGRSVLSNVMFYAESIQNLPAGWSNVPVSEIKLKQEQQFFLDPYRMDSDFQTAKNASDWQNVVASDFAQWLNRKIQGRDKKFTPQSEHTKIWRALMLDELREHSDMVKAVIAANRGEQA